MIIRTSLGFAAGVALVLGLTMPAAHAAASGSFSKTCQDIVDDDATVIAQCKKKNGSYTGTSLAYTICQGDVWNDNGKLKCTPKGSFKNSCNTVSWNTSYLTANCRKKDGKYLINSGFSYGTCLTNGKDIANIDGSLTCQ